MTTDYRLFDGRYIETSGYFSFNFEDVAIYTNKLPSFGNNLGFWAEISPGFNRESLEELNGKKITIRGVLDISDKGHLGSYVATIKNIYHISYK